MITLFTFLTLIFLNISSAAWESISSSRSLKSASSDEKASLEADISGSKESKDILGVSRLSIGGLEIDIDKSYSSEVASLPLGV